LVVVAGLLLAAMIARGAPPPSPPTNTSAVLSAAQVPKDLDELRSFETRVERVVAKVVPSTVGLRVGNSQGSGVIVSATGLILTAGHLINKVGEPVTIVMQDGRAHKGVTLGYDRAMDSGMVKVTCKCPGPWIPVDLGQSADLADGTWCIAVGHPFGFLEGRPPVVRV
jgi:serine protease Do